MGTSCLWMRGCIATFLTILNVGMCPIVFGQGANPPEQLCANLDAPGWTDLSNETTGTLSVMLRESAAFGSIDVPEVSGLIDTFSQLCFYTHQPDLEVAESLLDAKSRVLRADIAKPIEVWRSAKTGAGGDDSLAVAFAILEEDSRMMDRVGQPDLLGFCAASLNVEHSRAGTIKEVKEVPSTHRSSIKGARHRAVSIFALEGDFPTAQPSTPIEVVSVQVLLKSYAITSSDKGEVVGDFKFWFVYVPTRQRWYPISFSLRGETPVSFLF